MAKLILRPLKYAGIKINQWRDKIYAKSLENIAYESVSFSPESLSGASKQLEETGLIYLSAKSLVDAERCFFWAAKYQREYLARVSGERHDERTEDLQKKATWIRDVMRK